MQVGVNDREEFPGSGFLALKVQKGHLACGRVEAVHLLGLTDKLRMGAQHMKASKQKAAGHLFCCSLPHYVMEKEG